MTEQPVASALEAPLQRCLQDLMQTTFASPASPYVHVIMGLPGTIAFPGGLAALCPMGNGKSAWPAFEVPSKYPRRVSVDLGTPAL